jgi:hypothetical protein
VAVAGARGQALLGLLLMLLQMTAQALLELVDIIDRGRASQVDCALVGRLHIGRGELGALVAAVGVAPECGLTGGRYGLFWWRARSEG